MASARHAGMRLSPVRVALTIVIVIAIAAVAVLVPLALARQDAAQRGPAGPGWFGGYFDATAAAASEMPVNDSGAPSTVVLAFVVAAAADECTPSWGAAYSMAEAASQIDLDRKVARIRERGDDIAVSFGGAINTELAVACTDPADLADAYRSVIDRYDGSFIDLDLEYGNLTDEAAGQRRAQAVAQLQKEYAADGSPLAVWLTLPVAPDGLTGEGMRAVEQMLAAGVDLAGVNVMTMDYGVDLAGRSMADASEDALRATHGQLSRLLSRYEAVPASGDVWSMLGATPMIGQNDVPAEVFTLDDAAQLNEFAAAQGLGRMSMWSLNRDRTCGPNYPDTTVVSDSCSGVQQNGQSFAAVLSQGMDTTPVSTATPTVTQRPTAEPTDDPATSPYPVWSEDVSYSSGVKVVWRGNVYTAKWWTQGGAEPDDPTLTAEETPWVYVGPVLPGDKPFTLPTAPPGTYPEWTPDGIYRAGDRVLYQGTPYVAKWFSQGESPAVGITDKDRSPWRLLTEP